MKKILVLFIISVFCYGWIANASIFSSEVVYKEVEVNSNDTLWDIAAKEVDNKTDIRKYIYDIQKINHIEHDTPLVPGQIIKVPVSYK